ncbi:MAG: hypothetical protein M1826_005242 [Phylliscum demangeonii]|nr:MAG: hypothetical protein M1826_005242 [Phylliscum demangeonii]
MFSRSRVPRGNQVCAIFVHAGAGFHSRENQKRHLQACSDAAYMGMTVLKAGGTAVDAVELAIRVLEDREITNAGYGSNLAIDGVVEGDASIVDDFGRSGAVGAVCHIRNPISVARLVLLSSYEILSLRRVPPNLLVGEGATDFAFEHGIPVLPHDALVSPSSRERWVKWCQDLREASRPPPANILHIESIETGLDPEEIIRRRMRSQHARTMEGLGLYPTHLFWKPQIAPYPAPALALSTADTPMMPGTPRDEADPYSTVALAAALQGGAHLTAPEKDRSATAQPRLSDRSSPDDPAAASSPAPVRPTNAPLSNGGYGLRVEVNGHDGLGAAHRDTPVNADPQTSSTKSESATTAADTVAETATATAPSVAADALPAKEADVQGSGPAKTSSDQAKSAAVDPEVDRIIDTVGAIAIDSHGRIAAGSSSGGIGMKHRGRVGPAALVGVGTAVFPQDPHDAEKVSVATVTSGTGEHIATTMAAATCADRLYHSVRSHGKGMREPASDDVIMHSVIEKDFMDHPSVKYSTSQGALGILAAKKTVDGIYVYFAHNTDSFAVATMHSEERVPTCTMSRNRGNGSIAQGARSIRPRRH